MEVGSPVGLLWPGCHLSYVGWPLQHISVTIALALCGLSSSYIYAPPQLIGIKA